MAIKVTKSGNPCLVPFLTKNISLAPSNSKNNDDGGDDDDDDYYRRLVLIPGACIILSLYTLPSTGPYSCKYG